MHHTSFQPSGSEKTCGTMLSLACIGRGAAKLPCYGVLCLTVELGELPREIHLLPLCSSLLRISPNALWIAVLVC